MSYTAVVLDQNSHQKLLSFFPPDQGWEPIAHHMTINMGDPSKGPAEKWLGQKVEITVISHAKDELVEAVGVECDVPSLNAIKHITVSVNREAGGKPFFSNKLKDWQPIKNFVLQGIVEEVK